MSIQVQEVEPCKLNIQYMADKTVVQSAQNKVIDQIKQQKVPVPGFRPGLAPNYAIKLRLKPQVDNLTVKELVSEAYNDFLFENKVKVMFQPQVNHHALTDDSFQCEMTVYKRPDVVLEQYKGFNIPKPASDKIEDLSAKILQDLRVQHGDPRPYDDGDFVQAGDKVTMDVVAEYNGEKISELTVEGLVYTVGQFHEMDENILGMSPGETKSFQVSMKDDAPVESIRGKLVDFTVNLHMGMRTEPAALDDTLAAKLGFPTFAELEQAVQGSASNQMKQREKQMLNDQVFSRLLEHSKVFVPQWLTDMEAQNLMRNRGVNFEQLPKSQKDLIRVDAEKAVKLSLILDAVRDSEPEAYFSETEMINSIRNQVESTGGNPDDFIKKSLEDGSLFGIIANMRDAATIDWILKNSTLSE